MPDLFARKLASTAAAEVPVTVYTVPASTVGVVIGFAISNLLITGIAVTITAAGKILGKDIPIPSGSSLSPIDGKLVLEAGDTLTVSCSILSGADIVLSVMERS